MKNNRRCSHLLGERRTNDESNEETNVRRCGETKRQEIRIRETRATTNNTRTHASTVETYTKEETAHYIPYENFFKEQLEN